MQRSRFVPKSDCETPAPEWKRNEWAYDVLADGDRALDPDAEIVER